MKYRIVIRPKWTILNNTPQNRWIVQYLFLGIIWIRTRDVWHSVEEAEQYIKDMRREY